MSFPDIQLGINIDHVATVRQARRAPYPDPVHAALLAEQAGADNITLHLREDRRHIQDRDVHALRPLLQTRMNLEMGLTDEMVDIAVGVRPQDCCLVPEKRAEITTEGGLDVAADVERVAAGVRKLAAAGIRVALFIAPDLAQIEAAKRSGAPVIELHTGTYADATGSAQARELERLATAAQAGGEPRPRSACRAWAHLQQCDAGGRDRRDRRAQHRPLHRRARHFYRARTAVRDMKALMLGARR